MTQISDETINRAIHRVMGLCAHENIKWVDEDGGPGIGSLHFPQCQDCPEITDGRDLPDYANSLDAVARAEAFVIEKVGWSKYVDELCFYTEIDPDDAYRAMSQVATASARTRCLAILKAMEIDL